MRCAIATVQPPNEFSAEIQEILCAVDPLRRPDPFGLEAALDGALGPDDQATEAAISLAISLAEELLRRSTRCDVFYTYNVLQLVERASKGLGEVTQGEPSNIGLRIRMHCVAASARSYHQAGEKASNLARAGQHLANAEALDAANIAPERLAAALLNFVRAVEVVPAAAPNVDVPGVYQRILELTANGSAPDLRAVALANLIDRARAAQVISSQSPFDERDPEVLAVTLEAYETSVLPLAVAAAATYLGECYLVRAEHGDGARAIRWLQAGERSFYYYAYADPKQRARNQLGIARYFSRVHVAEADDQEYVHNKALFSVQFAYASADGDPDIQAECFQTAAHIWARSDLERARGFVDQALAIEGVSSRIRGRLYLERARSRASEPEVALPDATQAIAIFEAASAESHPDIDAGLAAALELKATLLVNAEALRNRRTRAFRIPAAAITLMSRVASAAAERGDLGQSYLAHRRMARWCMDVDDPEQALVHYRRGRDTAQAMLDSGTYERLANEFDDALASNPSLEEARATAIANPSATLRAAQEQDQIAVQIAAIDHQVAAFCAARTGRFEEALDWAIAGRLRKFRYRLRGTQRASAWTRASLAAAGRDSVIVIPLVYESSTIVIVCHAGEIAAVFPIERFTHYSLRRHVYDADDSSVTGWLTAYQEIARDTPFIDLAAEGDPDASRELWWALVEETLAAFATEFAIPLHAGLVDHGFADATLLLVPPALLSLVPLHAIDLAQDMPFFVAHPTELGFTPSLPGWVASGNANRDQRGASNDPPRSVLAVAGDNELLYTSLELRTVARLLASKPPSSTAPRRHANRCSPASNKPNACISLRTASSIPSGGSTRESRSDAESGSHCAM
jgi:hypothetical protein